jgi:Glycosyl transferases group 1
METLAIFTEQRCWTGPEGFVHGRKELGAVAALSEILGCTVVARMTEAEEGGSPVLPAQGAGMLVPWPRDAFGIMTLIRTMTLVWSAIGRHKAVAVYCPGVLSTMAGLMAIVRRRRLVVVAVGNPEEALSAEMMPGVAGSLARRVITTSMKCICRHADVTRYVTMHIQNSFPPGHQTAVFGITDVGNLTFGDRRTRPSGTLNLLTVASLDQPYKGVAELIDAVNQVRAHGHDVKLTVAGTGRLLDALEAYATESLGESSRFLGHVTGPSLQQLYAASDLFVLASWTEGLPRALVEAMAAGLPCVATAVGGVPELLEPHRLVAARNTHALVGGLDTMLNNPAGWATSSEFNIAAARRLGLKASAAEPKFTNAVRECLSENK